jgi:hypothetical protein
VKTSFLISSFLFSISLLTTLHSRVEAQVASVWITDPLKAGPNQSFEKKEFNGCDGKWYEIKKNSTVVFTGLGEMSQILGFRTITGKKGTPAAEVTGVWNKDTSQWKRVVVTNGCWDAKSR